MYALCALRSFPMAKNDRMMNVFLTISNATMNNPIKNGRYTLLNSGVF